MAIYRCTVCGYLYDEEAGGAPGCPPTLRLSGWPIS